MDYFLLDEHTGELRTAKPLDREALPDGAGIMKLTVRVCIVVVVLSLTLFAFFILKIICFLFLGP